jgi:K+-sensing histidine kinase KdpD
MTQKQNLIRNLLFSGKDDDFYDVEKTRRLTIINGMSYFGTIMLLIVAIVSGVMWALGELNSEIGLSMVIENPVIALFFIFIILYLRKTGNIGFASYYFSVIATITFSYFFFIPDLKSIGPFYAFLLPIGYFFFLGRRNGSIASALYAILVYFSL